MTFRELGNKLLFWLGFPTATWYFHGPMAFGWIPALAMALPTAIVLIVVVNVVVDQLAHEKPPSDG